MCALAPFPIPNWPLLDPIGYELNFIYQSSESIETSLLQFPPPQEEVLLDSQSPASFTQTSFDTFTVKKLNHNASERERRKRVNSLYSSLRSLLPVADQMKKLSFPATVSQALKYIPELQQQVERLVQKREKLLSRISQEDGLKGSQEQQKISRSGRSLSTAAVSISRPSDSEIAIHISILQKVHKTHQLSEILDFLEQEGFLLQNATSFESFGGMILYNIHLQVETTCKLESDALSEKLLALCDNS
ncbi:hypothetical protein DITRI_Ditri05aG0092100 [Diplodiscus trichospermus]